MLTILNDEAVRRACVSRLVRTAAAITGAGEWRGIPRWPTGRSGQQNTYEIQPSMGAANTS
jgi:hypothetical protein